MLRAPDLMEHYLYVSTTFLALLLGVTVGLVGGLIPCRAGGVDLRWISGAVFSAIVLMAVVPVFPFGMKMSKGYVGGADDPIAWVQYYVPEGACVVADVSTILIASDRFQSEDQNCPPPVDPFGMWQAQPTRTTPFQNPNASAELLSTWRDYLDRAQFVVMSVDYSNFLPWSGGQRSWFDQRFRMVGKRGGVVLYEKI